MTTETEERRETAHAAADELSPEYLAMLVVCGGRVRDSDWAVLPPSLAARRNAAPPPSLRRLGPPSEPHR